ncbi:hypothetical protein GBA52_010051 [Prunus armeniaca]|nr:hypothetical protein GBA52_010051 [Prunus armeniaca]
MWDPRDPNSDFLNNGCHGSCFDVDIIYVIVLELVGRDLIALDPCIFAIGCEILDLRDIENKVDDVVGRDILEVVGDFGESHERCVPSDV